MSAYVSEEHMALGGWELELDYSPELAAELIHKRHIIIYDAEADLTYMGVLLRTGGDETGLVAGGRGMLWWLGTEDEGPLLVDHEFISGTNKLSNPGFELDLENLGLLNWSIPANSKWEQAVGQGRSGWGAAAVVGDPDEDDILKSEESWEAREGETYVASFWAWRASGAVGRVRVRPVYTGRFTHPNIFPNPAAGGWTPWGVAGMTIESNGDIRIGSLARPQVVLNAGFDGGLAQWYLDVGIWQWDGGHAMYTETGPAYKAVRNDHGFEPELQGALVQPQERWLFELYVVGGAATDGQVEMAIGWVFDDPADPAYDTWSIETLRGPVSAGQRNHMEMEASVPTSPNGVPAFGFVYYIFVRDQTADRWTFIAPTATRISQNLADYGSPYFDVKPGRAYRAKIPYRSVPGARGEVRTFLILKAADRPDTVLQGPSLPSTAGVNDVEVTGAVVEWNFTVPSGYSSCQIVLRAIDVMDEWVVSPWDLREADSGTYYTDTSSLKTQGDWTWIARSLTAPRGTQRVHMEIIAEDQAGGWLVDEASLVRHWEGETLSLVANVARELIRDPDTGLDLLIPGSIGGNELIPVDWRIRNRTLRDCLNHLCAVIAPGYEYVIKPNRTFDFDFAANLFTDHAPETADAVVLLPRDRDVAGVPGVEKNSEEKVTRIRLVGGEREASTGMPTEIVVTAPVVSPDDEADWNGNAINRTRVVEDSSVDHYIYANAKVTDLAAQEADEPYSISVELRGRDTRPSIVAGDWVYAYHPEAGLEDTAYQTEIDGEPVFLKRARVLSVTRKLGPSYTAWLRRPDGSLLDISGWVRWEKEDSTALTIGRRPLGFATDPQGGTAARQYALFRLSSPR